MLITESEKLDILNLYGLVSDDVRPLQKLMTCRFTPDGKYVVYEGNAYSTKTGESVLLNESWSLSDILHTGADLLSVGLDFVIPGTGAIVDVLNAISYIIEAQFKSEKEKDSLYLMAAITFGFVIMPGPLQAIAGPLKNAVKTGAGMASKLVVKGLKIIGGFLDTLLLGIPSLVNKALKSPLAKTIVGSWGKKISGFIDSFTSRVKPMLQKITGMSGKKAGTSVAKVASKEVGFVIKQSDVLINSGIKRLSGGANLLTKIGIQPGLTVGKRAITNLSDDFVEYTIVGVTKKMPTWEFIKTFILKPSAKLNSTYVPLIVKAIVRCVNSNGSIDTEKLNKIKISKEQAQKELNYLSGLVAKYEGDTKNYTVNNNATNVQNALIMLGYSLPKFGADGKFGPETKDALTKFQKENELTSSIGKMDRFTARKLSELLKSKNIKNSDEIQSALNKI